VRLCADLANSHPIYTLLLAGHIAKFRYLDAYISTAADIECDAGRLAGGQNRIEV
jgi:hypothetical protein